MPAKHHVHRLPIALVAPAALFFASCVADLIQSIDAKQSPNISKQASVDEITKAKSSFPVAHSFPRDIPGTLLKNRIDEWHQHHSNQPSAASMVHTVTQPLAFPPAVNFSEKRHQTVITSKAL